MTETTVHSGILLSPSMRKVVLHWGEMGQAWGVNRSQGQIHALLYLLGRRVTAEDIADTLGLARSNVSTSIKELLDWDLISREQVLGDRRDYFVSKGDLWDVLMAIAEGRKQREIDPTIEFLERAAQECQTDKATPPDVRKRIEEMHKFVANLAGWYDQVKTIKRSILVKLMGLGARIARFVGG